MNTQVESEFHDIIFNLQSLKGVVPDEEFRNRVKKTHFSKETSSFSFFSIFSLSVRLTIILFLLFLTGVSSIVVAASTSKPGDLLYPVKQVVKSVTEPFIQNEQDTKSQPEPLQQEQTGKESKQEVKKDMTQSSVSGENELSVPPTNQPNQIVISPVLSPTQATVSVTTANVGGMSLSIDLSAQNTQVASPSPENKTNVVDAVTTLLPVVNVQLNTGEKPLIKIGL